MVDLNYDCHKADAHQGCPVVRMVVQRDACTEQNQPKGRSGGQWLACGRYPVGCLACGSRMPGTAHGRAAGSLPLADACRKADA